MTVAAGFFNTELAVVPNTKRVIVPEFPSRLTGAATSLDQLFRKYIPKYSGVRDERRQHLINTVVEFLFHRSSAKTMAGRLGCWDKFPDSEPLRLAIKGDGYLSKNLKLFLFSWIRTGKRHIGWLENKYDSGIPRLLDPELVEWIRITHGNYACLSLPRFNELLGMVVEETAVLLRKNMPNQYRWVIESQPVSVEELIHTVQIHGIQSVHESYPCISNFRHAVLIAGKSMKNFSMNLYHYHSADDRQAIIRLANQPNIAEPCRIIQAGREVVVGPAEADAARLAHIRVASKTKYKGTAMPDGPFVPVVLAESASSEARKEHEEAESKRLAEYTEQCRKHEVEYKRWEERCVHLAEAQNSGRSSRIEFGARNDPTALDFMATEADPIEAIDNRMTAETILNSISNPSKIEFLKLLAGVYHAGFTAYLQNATVIPAGVTNEDWQERAPIADQVRYAATYVGFVEQDAASFLGELRAQFSPAAAASASMTMH